MEKMKIEQVAMRLGVSVQTLNRWYKYKKQNPEDTLAQGIPQYTLINTSRGRVRFWTEEDVWNLIKFKQSIVSGRAGKMGRYGGKGTNGEKKSSRRAAEA